MHHLSRPGGIEGRYRISGGGLEYGPGVLSCAEGKKPLQGASLCVQSSRSNTTEPSVIVADARLEGRDELAAALGLPPETCSATLIVRAWSRWGVASLSRLSGDFAFVLLDRAAGQLVLARDALGRRPLHFAHHDDVLVFASAPLLLARYGGHVRADIDRLAMYVAGLPETGASSFFEGVSRVMPGHLVTVNADGELLQTRWWNPSLRPTRLSFDSAVRAVQSELDRAILGAVEDAPEPLAAHLSGGLDSALICANTVRLRPDARLITLTGGPGGPLDGRQSGHFEDESERAMASAAAIGKLEPHMVSASPQSPLEAARRDSSFAERPFLNPCNSSWIDATYERARRLGANVILEGMIGNHTVSWDGFERLGELFKRGRLIELGREIVCFRRSGGGSASGIARWALTEAWPALERGDIFHDRFLRPGSISAGNLVPLIKRTGRPRSSAAYRLSLIEFVDPGLVQHAVRARFGLDQRDPLGSRSLVELCLRIPARHFFRRGTTRRIARALLRGAVPDRIVDEPRRGLQGGDWRAGAEPAIPAMLRVVDAAASDERLAKLFDLPRLRETLLAWPAAGWDKPKQVMLYRRHVIRAVCALQWVAQVDGWSLNVQASPQ